jgi:hypothetical protein
MSATMNMKPANRDLCDIAREIRRDWKKVNFAAVPYLSAMASMGDIRDSYGYDSGKSVVLYFLGNAGTWRGDVAKRVKAELKALAK